MVNWSTEEYKAYLKKQGKPVKKKKKDNSVTKPKSEDIFQQLLRELKEEEEPKKKSKYNNKKVIVDDIAFDSKKEADEYLLLKIRKKNGEIKDFSLQPKYVLQDSYVNNKGEKIKAITYKGDYWILHNDNSEEVVDVKGFRTEVFNIKKKLFEYKYPHIKFTLT